MDNELTTAINTDDYSHLPSADEFEAAISVTPYMIREWSDPRYQCRKCGGGMCKNETLVFSSNPPMYLYKCNRCGHVEYQFK